ncbi:hypothetical protein AND_006531 [Anopheles darlingi]|uniref:Uncharacterized protein n=1 Tax=Anopheles darlingi TaxID=43151 RepID=W5JG57_ANODA|nr:hypothetical protein AND_006531 [Anopheles darlingi]
MQGRAFRGRQCCQLAVIANDNTVGGYGSGAPGLAENRFPQLSTWFGLHSSGQITFCEEKDFYLAENGHGDTTTRPYFEEDRKKKSGVADRVDFPRSFLGDRAEKSDCWHRKRHRRVAACDKSVRGLPKSLPDFSRRCRRRRTEVRGAKSSQSSYGAKANAQHQPSERKREREPRNREIDALRAQSRTLK